jgi:hypothetical protein
VPARISRLSAPLVGEPRGPHIRKVHGTAVTELRRYEADRLDPDVPAGGKSRLGNEANATAGTKGVDPARHLVDSDELASETAEGRGRHGDSALEVRSTGCHDRARPRQSNVDSVVVPDANDVTRRR